ncbi:MAG TPA: aromatic prenyltransferase [Actinophytocola sp.]|jgi:hypothetical protein|nr:aromatic prenyltransferase [Actinophytocola sp.]
MSGNTDLATLYSAIEDSARLLDVDCARERVWPILSAYGDAIGNAVVAFRVATGARHKNELDCRFTTTAAVDPYALALSQGFTTPADHPVSDLLTDIAARCPVDSYGIDFGVVGGFKKIWVFFPPDDLQSVSKLADVPAMPRGLTENVGFFARHGLDDRANLVGIDYHHRTVNVYVGEPPAECLAPAAVSSMLRDIGMPAPSEQLQRLAARAFGVYATFSWDSAKIERLTFAVMTPDPATLPVSLEEKIERFVQSAPYSAAGSADLTDRKFVYAVSSAPEGEYYKLQSYYQWRPRILNRMRLANTAAELV